MKEKWKQKKTVNEGGGVRVIKMNKIRKKQNSRKDAGINTVQR